MEIETLFCVFAVAEQEFKVGTTLIQADGYQYRGVSPLIWLKYVASLPVVTSLLLIAVPNMFFFLS